MININFLTANHFPRIGGMEIAVHNLVKELQATGQVQVALSCATMPEIPKDFSYSYPCYRAKSFSFLTPFLFKRNQIKMIKKEKPNLLYGPMLHGGGFYAMQMSKKFDIPFIAHSHGSDVQVVPEIGYGACLNDFNKEKIKKVIQKANKLIAISQINKQNMMDLGASECKIEVIHNGVHWEEINKLSYINIRPQFGFVSDDFILMSVGRNSPVKRMELLFAALAILKDKKDIKCLCVGAENNIKNLVAKFNIQDKLVFTGIIPRIIKLGDEPPFNELIQLYKNVDLYIASSYVEAFSLASIESLSSGTPIVIGKKHGVKDVIIPNKTGWIMEKESPHELAEIILSLYQKREELKASKEMISNSVSHLTWTKIAQQTINIYKQII
jgi:glycosyltransferase involved in cell wall biosynthesis